MFEEACGGLGGDKGLAEVRWLAVRGSYLALQDGWANTIGLFLAQRENTAFSVMKR